MIGTLFIIVNLTLGKKGSVNGWALGSVADRGLCRHPDCGQRPRGRNRVFAEEWT